MNTFIYITKFIRSKRIKFLIPVLLLQISFNALSHNDSLNRPLGYSVRGHYGFILIHSSAISSFAGQTPVGFEAEIFRFNIRNEDFIKCNCWSNTGISVAFYNFGLPQILGNAINVNSFFEPILFNNRFLNVGLRLGCGFSFLNKVYKVDTNPTNLFFSSKVSFTLIGGVRIQMPISEQFRFEGSCWYNHISNGGIKQPNKGMNYPTFSLGINYFPNWDQGFDYKVAYIDEIKRDKLLFLRTFFSGKVMDKNEEYPLMFCPISGISAGYIYPFGKLSILSLSTGYEYDEYLNESLRRKNRDIQKAIIDLSLGYGINAGNFTFILRNGFYILRPVNQNDIVFQQYDLFYKIGKRIRTGVYLKAHRHVAEHMGISLFYIFLIQG